MATDVISEKVETFFAQYKPRQYHKGQVLILNGDDTNYIYHLKEGRVKVYDVTYRGDEIILNIFKPPAFFPMSLAINKVTNPYIYEAETDIVVRQAPAEDVVTFIKDNPDVLFDLLARVYRGVDGVLARMVHLMSSSAKARLMYEIMVGCKRFGEQSSDGVYHLKINEIELAARAGLSRETVSRQMRSLVKDGLVKLKGHSVVVEDMAALEKKLGVEL